MEKKLSSDRLRSAPEKTLWELDSQTGHHKKILLSPGAKALEPYPAQCSAVAAAAVSVLF